MTIFNTNSCFFIRCKHSIFKNINTFSMRIICRIYYF